MPMFKVTTAKRRALAGLVAAVLGTAGLTLALGPSFAQEPQTPATENETEDDQNQPGQAPGQDQAPDEEQAPGQDQIPGQEPGSTTTTPGLEEGGPGRVPGAAPGGPGSESDTAPRVGSRIWLPTSGWSRPGSSQ